MKNKSLYSCLAFILFVGLFSCKKPPVEPEPTGPVMPPLTHEGLNTFGCYIDGELFVANDGESVWAIPPVSGGFDENTGDFIIQGTRYRHGILPDGDASDDVRIFVEEITNTGKYNYKFLEDGTLGYGNLYEENVCDYYYFDIPNLGEITITYLDQEENIIAGTFYMTLTNQDCEYSKTMKITDGRFDYRY